MAGCRWLGGLAGWLVAMGMVAFTAGANPAAEPVPVPVPPARLRFEVSPPPGGWPSHPARLLLAVAPPGVVNPWTRIGDVGAQAITLLGADVGPGCKPGPVRLDRDSALFPWRSLGELPPGSYRVQALVMTNRDLWRPDAPGNWLSPAREVLLQSTRSEVVRLTVDASLPVETLPPETEFVRYRRIRSERLSRFWGRDMYVRVSVVVPRVFQSEPERRFPVLVHVGGYAGRYDRVAHWFKPGAEFGRVWAAPETPQWLVVALDGAGPLGDPYQIDSDNHGPYGEALMEEILPAVEKEFRGIGESWARLTTGGSTGGWVSFALQVLYPDRFGGCWSGFPDPLDFQDFQLVNLYSDANAFVNAAGFERPSARTRRGDVDFTMRHEVQHENVLGLGDRFTRSGGQWGAWNAVFGARSPAGDPVPAWDSRSGKIDPAAVAAWRRYDLTPLLATNWATLGPKLRGKLHVWVGEADEYFLNHGVHRLDDFLRTAQPPAEAEVRFDARAGHGWEPLGWAARWQEWQRVVEKGAPQPATDAREAYFRSRFLHGAACPHCKGGR
jgi:hypothetical protein